MLKKTESNSRTMKVKKKFKKFNLVKKELNAPQEWALVSLQKKPI